MSTHSHKLIVNPNYYRICGNVVLIKGECTTCDYSVYKIQRMPSGPANYRAAEQIRRVRISTDQNTTD